jgi:hypothetical protein
LIALMPFAWTDATSRRGSVDDFDYLGKSAELRWLDQEAKGGRAILGDYLPYVVGDLPPDAAYVSRTRIAFGYNPLSLDSTTDLYTLPSRTFLRLMAVRCYATASDKWKVEGFSMDKKGKVVLGKNREATPFVYSPKMGRVVPDAAARLALMRDPKFNPWEVSLFSKAPDGAGSIDPRGLSSWERTQDDPDDQTFQVQMAGGAPVVFSEIMFPGWKALVDGQPSEIVTANHVFRSVWVPAGNHRVDFHYRPHWAWSLLLGLLFWSLSLLARPWRLEAVKPRRRS